MSTFFGGRARRHALLVPLALAGCVSSPADSCGDVFSGLDLTNSGLGNGNFVYACPATGGADAWCDSTDTTTSTSNIPTVAVGAAFSLAYGDTADPNLVPTPAVPSTTTLAPGASSGDSTSYASAPVALNAPGSYAFVAYSTPPTIRDFINIQAAAATTLTLTPSPSTLNLPDSPLTIEISPFTSYGELLAGAFTCTFESSNPSVLSATASGRGAILTLFREGKSVLSVSCLGVTSKTTIAVGSTSEDAGDDDAGKDAATKDAARGDATTEDAGDARSPTEDDAESDAGPDATVSDADADGGE